VGHIRQADRVKSDTSLDLSAIRQKRKVGALYLLFLGMDRVAASRLSSTRILASLIGRKIKPTLPIPRSLFCGSATWDARARKTRSRLPVSTFTRVEDWFSFHRDETAHEEQDQATLESLWMRLHAAMPELGDSIEVIETATPAPFMRTTRTETWNGGRPSARVKMRGRLKLGTTIFPNVFVVGDTGSEASGLEESLKWRLHLADLLHKKVTASRSTIHLY